MRLKPYYVYKNIRPRAKTVQEIDYIETQVIVATCWGGIMLPDILPELTNGARYMFVTVRCQYVTDGHLTVVH